MINNMLCGSYDLDLQPCIICAVCQGNQAIEPIWKRLVERTIFVVPSKPGILFDNKVEIVFVSRKAICHQLKLVFQPSQRLDGPERERMEGEACNCGGSAWMQLNCLQSNSRVLFFE